MAGEGQAGRRKRRTREHIIADRSLNHFERYVLQCGFSAERIERDYGIDLMMFTYDETGGIENGHVSIQLKSSDSIDTLRDQRTIAYSVRRSDLELWLSEVMPCILVLYDARSDVAYWLYLQRYFAQRRDFDMAHTGDTVTVHLQVEDVVDESAIKQFAAFKAAVLSQARGVIRHDS